MVMARNPRKKNGSATKDVGQNGRRPVTRSRQDSPPIYEHLPIGIVETSVDGRFINVNEEFCRIVGYRKQELLELGIVDVTHRDDYAVDIALHRDLIAGKIPFYKLRKRFVRRNGQVIWVELTRSIFRNSRGKPVYSIGVVLDITERQMAETALAEYARQQEALYRLGDDLHSARSLEDVYNAALNAISRALQCSRASILLYDTSGVMRFVAWRGLSEGYRRVTEGHTPWQTGDGDPAPVCVSDIGSADFSDSLKEVIRAEGIGSLAFIPLLSQGRLIGKFMIYYDTPHAFDEGEVDISLTIARQLSSSIDRKRAEEALHASEKLYRTIARSIPGGGVYVVDQDFRYVVAEGPVTQAFGLSREMLEGHTIYEIYRPEQSARMEERLKRTFAGETVSYETDHDGRVYWTQQAPIPGSHDHVIILTQDITDRKRAVEALRESEAQFRAILNQATAGIVCKNLDGTLTFVNEAFCRMLGYTAEELAGRTIWEFTHQDDLGENKRLYDKLMRDRMPFQLEKRLIRRDGSILWVNVSVSPVMNAKGRPQSAVAVEVDITDRKKAEEALQQLNVQLESRVEQRTAELRVANRALQANRRRLVQVQEEERRAIARELHDRVGQSLAALNINLNLIHNHLADQVTEPLRKRLFDSIQLIGQVIPAVRDVMANLRPAVLDDYGLEVALRNNVKDFEARYGLAIDLAMPRSPLPRLDASIEMTILRIAQESIFNIARHARASRVKLALLYTETDICLSIEDDGLGMELRPAAAHPPGHGLTIMRERAEAVGGVLAIRSAPGKGTRVEVTIPFHPASQGDQ